MAPNAHFIHFRYQITFTHSVYLSQMSESWDSLQTSYMLLFYNQNSQHLTALTCRFHIDYSCWDNSFINTNATSKTTLSYLSQMWLCYQHFDHNQRRFRCISLAALTQCVHTVAVLRRGPIISSVGLHWVRSCWWAAGQLMVIWWWAAGELMVSWWWADGELMVSAAAGKHTESNNPITPIRGAIISISGAAWTLSSWSVLISDLLFPEI